LVLPSTPSSDRFTGTRAWIFGHLLESGGGSISLSYRIDNGSSFSNDHTYQPNSEKSDIRNYQLVDTGPLAPGTHTLEVNLTKSISQAFIVDYIEYTPSFDTLSTMPNVGSFSNSPPPIASSRKVPAGAIAGGVVGGIAVLVLVAISVYYFCIRRRQKKTAHTSMSFW
jgi:hypothetical protein